MCSPSIGAQNLAFALGAKGVVMRLLVVNPSTKGEAQGNDAYVLASFDDSGLDAARTVTHSPVIGIGEGAFHVASSLIRYHCAIITSLSRSIGPIETNRVKYGLDRHCVKFRSAELPVLALEQLGFNAQRHISAEIRPAKTEDRAEATVLGPFAPCAQRS
jgi:allantoin racemase